MHSSVPRVTVLMPTYKQAYFICRALASLQAQTFPGWELVIVNDGSPDNTQVCIEPYLSDGRIHYHAFDHNQGLGATLNYALDHAQGELIAYLPSDDVYYAHHLSTLVHALDEHSAASLAYTGVRHHYNRYAEGQIDGYPLQLVQVMHRRLPERWLERAELTTDDIERMYWTKLRPHGAFIATHIVSCEWVNHPQQRHKIVQEPVGGINPYRVYYQVHEPMRFHTSVGNFIDEVEHYRRFREQSDTPPASDTLKILLVGELAYNAERILALQERGHKLYGLWTPQPYWYNTVGPLPFGHIEEVSHSHWREAIKAIRPDVIYALLNWQAVPFAHEVLMAGLNIPFIWHFKEGPFICLEQGTWSQLLDLYTLSQGQIYSSPQMQHWMITVAPQLAESKHSYVLDGDLPKADWFGGERSPLLSAQDGEFHTVVPGRPIGLHAEIVAILAQQGIHLHFYGDFTQGQWAAWIAKARQLAPQYLHLHAHVDQEHWLSEFSQYDAGWLHFLKSENKGDIRRANWDDLNYPARMATLALAGVPLLQYDNHDAVVATDQLARSLDIGLFFRNMHALREQLNNHERMDQLRKNTWSRRTQFTFDTHADALLAFFRAVIQV